MDTFPLAVEAARVLASADIHNAEDRAAVRAARQRLADALPAGEDPRDHISRALHWTALNDIARACHGLPLEMVR